MSKKGGSSVLKRQRELKKAEKALEKREQRRPPSSPSKPQQGFSEASDEDLRGYGVETTPPPSRNERS